MSKDELIGHPGLLLTPRLLLPGSTGILQWAEASRTIFECSSGVRSWGHEAGIGSHCLPRRKSQQLQGCLYEVPWHVLTQVTSLLFEQFLNLSAKQCLSPFIEFR